MSIIVKKAEVDEAVKDIENPLLKFAATFGHSLTKPNLLAAGAGSSLPPSTSCRCYWQGCKR